MDRQQRRMEMRLKRIERKCDLILKRMGDTQDSEIDKAIDRMHQAAAALRDETARQRRQGKDGWLWG